MLMPRERLRALFEEHSLALSDGLYARLEKYAELLVDWNGRMNLTAITDPEGIAVRHFLDSLLPLTMFTPPQGASLIDVGTGAGFPGVPFALYRPDLRLTLLDSLGKRVRYLEELSGALQLGAACVHARAEDAGRDKAFRERFEVATARAVAALPVLAEYCLPFVKPGGVFLALKGPQPSEELAAARRAVRLLGSEVEDVVAYELLPGEGRTLIVMRKISQTPTEYPRCSAKMAKNPL